ncbi:hypothetical protein, partial [Candidatus Binatus sp.]|uniref:hypothetical protein n=1 Tax=Candidatus Binatus sp. TaxID=2811406 RepID=UPI003C415FFB
HDCELDKEKRRGRVHMVMLKEVLSLNAAEQEKVTGSYSHSRMVLPDLPGTTKTLYADLRAVVTLDRELVDTCNRIASLSDIWVQRLQAQIVAFFTRLGKPD